jgi:hypothetical protein
MKGVQRYQLATLLADWGEQAGGDAASAARELVARWQAAGYAATGQLSPGDPWVWATRKGLDACRVSSRRVKPAERLLRHTHAVTEVRLAVQRTPAFREGGAWWRAERSMWGMPDFMGGTHVPDGEVRWPAGGRSPWAGEAWAVEIEISPKPVERTAVIMSEILALASDRDGLSGSLAVAGRKPRYARLVYVCSAAAVRVVTKARAQVGSPLSARIDVHDLPESATRLTVVKRGWRA